MSFPQHSFKNAIVGFTVGEKSLIMQLYAELKIDSEKDSKDSQIHLAMLDSRFTGAFPLLRGFPARTGKQKRELKKK